MSALTTEAEWDFDSLPERFWDRVTAAESGCWIWNGGQDGKGYGFFQYAGHHRRAHRVAYELLVGTIPDGLVLDHLCRVRNCVNPAHLEPVTSRENTLRGETLPALNLAKTHCVAGHEYATDTTYVNPEGHRICRICRREYQSQYHARKRSAALLVAPSVSALQGVDGTDGATSSAKTSLPSENAPLDSWTEPNGCEKRSFPTSPSGVDAANDSLAGVSDHRSAVVAGAASVQPGGQLTLRWAAAA